jgi:hypothetical protein
MVKVRIQLNAESKAGSLGPLSVAKEIYKEGGAGRFYRG